MKLLTLAALLLAGGVSAAHAQDAPGGMTPAVLYAMCEIAPTLAKDDDLCLVYITGFVRGLALGDTESTDYGRHVCIPDGVSGHTFESVVRDFMKAHPEMMKLTRADSVIGAAIYRTFACK